MSGISTEIRLSNYYYYSDIDLCVIRVKDFKNVRPLSCKLCMVQPYENCV